MRFVYLFLALTLTVTCFAEEDTNGDEVDEEEEVLVTEPPRSLIRPRRPLKLNRSTKVPSLEELDDEEQITSIKPTTTTTTKRPRTRSTSRATKAPVEEENLSTTKRPAGKNRNRNRNRNRNKNRNRSRTTTIASDDAEDVETTTKSGKRRPNGRRTTTPKAERSTTTKSTRSRTKSPSRGNRKRTTTPKSTTPAEEVKEMKEVKATQPTSKNRHFNPRPVSLTHLKPTSTTPINIEEENVNLPSKPPPKLPQQEMPSKPLEGAIDDKLSHLPPPVEVPLKRPQRPLPLEGEIDEEQLGEKQMTINPGGLKWEPVGVPPKLVGPLDRTKTGRVQAPDALEREPNVEIELPSPALTRPRPSTFRPTPRPALLEPAAKKLQDEEEEENAFSKALPTRPDVGVAPKPIGPVSLRPLLKRPTEKDIPRGSRKSTEAFTDDNDFPKPTTPRPKLPRSSSTRTPTRNSKLLVDDDDDVKTTRRPRTKSTKSTTAKTVQLEENNSKSQVRTPYPLRFDDGTALKSSPPVQKPKLSNSGIFSPFEEDLYDSDFRGKPTASVFQLKDKRVSSRPQALDVDEDFEIRPRKGSSSSKDRPLSRSVPTPAPKLTNTEKSSAAFKPSKQLGASPSSTPRSIPRPQAKFKVVDDVDEEEKEQMNKQKQPVMTKNENINSQSLPQITPNENSRQLSNSPPLINSPPMMNLPPRSRYLTVDSDTGIRGRDKIPPITDDPFFVPSADIGKSMPDGKEMSNPNMRQKEMMPKEMIPKEMMPKEMMPKEMMPKEMMPKEMMPKEMMPEDRELLPINREIEMPAKTKQMMDSRDRPELPADRVDNAEFLTLKPISSRPSSFSEDDVDSLALPTSRRVPTPTQRPRVDNTPRQPTLQVDFESPSFVIRKPVNLTTPSEEQPLPPKQPLPSKNIPEPSRQPKKGDTEFLEYEITLPQDPRSLAAALPAPRSNTNATPKLPDLPPENSRSQPEIKMNKQSQAKPTSPKKSASVTEEPEEYDDEDYEK